MYIRMYKQGGGPATLCYGEDGSLYEILVEVLLSFVYKYVMHFYVHGESTTVQHEYTCMHTQSTH